MHNYPTFLPPHLPLQSPSFHLKRSRTTWQIFWHHTHHHTPAVINMVCLQMLWNTGN